jgi:hypothetical protein
MAGRSVLFEMGSVQRLLKAVESGKSGSGEPAVLPSGNPLHPDVARWHRENLREKRRGSLLTPPEWSRPTGYFWRVCWWIKEGGSCMRSLLTLIFQSFEDELVLAAE